MATSEAQGTGTTVVLGASANPARYAYTAVKRLLQHGHQVIPVGIKPGQIDGLNILTGNPPLKNVDTITLYVGPAHQPGLYDYILNLNPRRLIFNPGTENQELEELAREQGIEIHRACTLVLLATGQY